MAPLCEDDEDYYRDAVRGLVMPGTPVSQPSYRTTSASRAPQPTRRDSRAAILAEGSRRAKRVQFSDSNGMELERTQRTSSTHHPTPIAAKTIESTSCTRRYAIDEVELYFSEETKFPAAKDDYAVLKFAKRSDTIVGGWLDCNESLMGIPRWKTYWAELQCGVIMLHKHKDVLENKKREPDIIPISGSLLRIVDVKDAELDIHFTYQGHRHKKQLRCPSKADLFLWWWAIQLASVTRPDSRLLHDPMKRQAKMPILQLYGISTTIENMLFPKAMPANSTNSRKPERESKTRIILVRHGETENIHFRVKDDDKRLTDRGVEQAAITARHLKKKLFDEDGLDAENVTVIYGGLRRTVDTALEFERAMPWLQYKYECCLLEDGAPDSIEHGHRQDFRAAMHRMAYEYICRHDSLEPQRATSNDGVDSVKILICHTSFVQHLVARCYEVPKDVVKIGAPIAHCSLSEIIVTNDVAGKEKFEVKYVNRVLHLPLTHRTSE
ncbi:hypothetical protein PINS_up001659 [Pythium insidiosum]|nr:hypothetical protein PINS_up001659 [Pythium insidiosum]